MSKGIWRVLCIIVVICMASSLFAACGGSGDKKGEASADKTATGGSSGTDGQGESKDGEVYEYNWLTINAPLEDGSWGQKYVEDKFNIKINVVRADTSKWDEQVSVLLATGDIPDLIWCNNISNVGNYARQGILAEVKPEDIQRNMPGYYKTVMDNHPKLFTYSIINGKNMALPLMFANGKYPVPAAIRADWLKNVGIDKVPETIQELEDAFLKFRNNDPDKNGKKDTYALSMASDMVPVLWFQSIFGAYGANPFIWRENGGKLEFGFTTENFKEAVKLLQKWYKTEIIDPEFITEKGRNSQKDIAFKFSAGKLGYIENLTFDDHQWDNDGHLSAKWVANNPAWKDFFDKNKDNSAAAYSTTNFTTFDDSVPQPIYVNLPPVKGPDGKSGYYRDGYQNWYLAFGKQLEKDQKKYDKLLQIMETYATDEQAYVEAHFGPEGKAWIKDADGTRIWNPNWSKDPDFHPQGMKLGVGYFANPMYWTNPAFLYVVGGKKAEQRYKNCGDVMAQFPVYENVLKSVLPSSAETSEITSTMVKDFIIKAVTSDMDIDNEFTAIVQKWMEKGGEKLTQEANEWYANIK